MEIEIKDLKHRTRQQGFLTGTRFEMKWIVEIRMGRKWVPLGTSENGITKFDSDGEADAAVRAFKAA